MAIPELTGNDKQHLQQDQTRSKLQIGTKLDGTPVYVRVSEDGYIITKLMGYDVDGSGNDIQVIVDEEGRLRTQLDDVTFTGDVEVDTDALENLVSTGNALLADILTAAGTVAENVTDVEEAVNDTKDKVDTTNNYLASFQDDYKFSDWLTSGTNTYVGYLRADGAWIIKKFDTANGQVRYVSGGSGYSFADPAGLSYDLFSTEF